MLISFHFPSSNNLDKVFFKKTHVLLSFLSLAAHLMPSVCLTERIISRLWLEPTAASNEIWFSIRRSNSSPSRSRRWNAQPTRKTAASSASSNSAKALSSSVRYLTANRHHLLSLSSLLLCYQCFWMTGADGRFHADQLRNTSLRGFFKDSARLTASYHRERRAFYFSKILFFYIYIFF